MMVIGADASAGAFIGMIDGGIFLVVEHDDTRNNQDRCTNTTVVTVARTQGPHFGDGRIRRTGRRQH